MKPARVLLFSIAAASLTGAVPAMGGPVADYATRFQRLTNAVDMIVKPAGMQVDLAGRSGVPPERDVIRRRNGEAQLMTMAGQRVTMQYRSATVFQAERARAAFLSTPEGKTWPARRAQVAADLRKDGPGMVRKLRELGLALRSISPVPQSLAALDGSTEAAGYEVEGAADALALILRAPNGIHDEAAAIFAERIQNYQTLKTETGNMLAPHVDREKTGKRYIRD